MTQFVLYGIIFLSQAEVGDYMGRYKYIRVSTKEQNTARQEVDSKEYKGVYIEKASGKDTDRPELKRMMEFVRDGDTVVVESYSRFARNTQHLLALVEELHRKNVAFVSLKENVDTTTPEGWLIFTIFAGLAQYEREQLLQRQAEGIAIAKAQGKYKGRQPITVNPTAFEKVYKEWKAGEITARRAMDRLGLKPNTFYRRVQALEKTILHNQAY